MDKLVNFLSKTWSTFLGVDRINRSQNIVSCYLEALLSMVILLYTLYLVCYREPLKPEKKKKKLGRLIEEILKKNA
jgi:hypothetical protein